MSPPKTTSFEESRINEVLRFILEKERLTKTLRHFEISKEELGLLFFPEEQSKKVIKKSKTASAKKKADATRNKKNEPSRSSSQITKSHSTGKNSLKTTSKKTEEEKNLSEPKKDESTSTKSEGKKKKAAKKVPKKQSSPRGRKKTFVDPESYIYRRLMIYTDGAARGNPGESGAGVVLKTPEGEEVGRFGRYLGRMTNNHAEYQAVLLGLQHAQEFGASEITILSDSELMVKQLLGEYQVRASHLKKTFDQIKEDFTLFEKYHVRKIPREKNTDADAMANRAIDEKL